MAEITQFRAVLPPDGQAFVPPPSKASPGGLILRALSPLRGELDSALARGDQERALRIAYAALSKAADVMASLRGDSIPPGQVRVHALLVQLKLLPLEMELDGTLSEVGTEVEISYRNWSVNRDEADMMAERLTQHCQSLWPGAWVMAPS